MMPARRSWSLFALALLLALPTAGPARGEDLSAKVEEYMRARVTRDRFSGVILVARDGKPLVRRAYGMANLEHDVLNTPETKFRLGSITKQFTAMAVMILQEKGKIDVHEKVKTYLPDAPKAWDEITVHHLLTHTSGIPSFTSFPDYVLTMSQHVTIDQLVARFRDKPLEFKPGEKFKYSNSGYVLLGKLIDKVSGKTYAEFLREAIFEPLGMKDTGYDNAIPILKHRASGYARPLFVTVNAAYIDMSIPHAAGALYSTVDDLLRWDQALSSETLVSKITLKKIFTPFKNHYAYGWVVAQEFGRKVIGHGGGINGFVTDIKRFPDERVCIVVLSNFEGSPVSAISHDLAAITFGEKYTIPGERKAAFLQPVFFRENGFLGETRGDSSLIAIGSRVLVPTLTRKSPNWEGDALGLPRTPTLAFVQSVAPAVSGKPRRSGWSARSIPPFKRLAPP